MDNESPQGTAQRALDELAGICAQSVLPAPWSRVNALLAVVAAGLQSPVPQATTPSEETPIIEG